MDSDSIIIHGSRPMLGPSDFADLRTADGLYVDKTALIREVVERGSETLAYLRPRRFGKSLALSMLKCFLDCRDPRPELFEGLEIARDRAFWDRHFGKYPVILLSLKSLDCDTFPKMLEKLADALQSMAEGFGYLLESKRLRASQKRFLEHLMDGTPTQREMEKSLSMLSRMLCVHHGQRCVILLDEYDVPLNRAHLKNYYAQAVDVIRPLMGMALKDNEALRFGLVTGCLRIARESIFTGLNHQDVRTVLTPESREWFGFSPRPDRRPTLRQRLLGHRRRRNPTLRRRVLPQGLRRRPGRRPQRPAVKSATQPKPKGVPKWALLLASKC